MTPLMTVLGAIGWGLWGGVTALAVALFLFTEPSQTRQLPPVAIWLRRYGGAALGTLLLALLARVALALLARGC